MAARKPLVLNAGQVEELQGADTLDAVVSEVDVISRTATSTLVPGEVVYSDSNTSVEKANANADATAKPIGVATAGITAASSGTIQTNGILTLTTGEWDAVAGTTGGLTAGTQYFLSGTTAGALTATAPSTSGHYVLPILVALSTTEAYILADWTQRIKKA